MTDIEIHPWKPFIPDNAKLLFLGTFPPGEHRRSMDFYYPNRTNDFWYLMGYLFFNDRNRFLIADSKVFDLPAIKRFLCEKGIALGDTALKVRRLKGNASDKFLEIVEPLDLEALLKRVTTITDIVTTGEKAASVIASLTSTVVPAMGEYVEFGAGKHIWRMPSTSRAYPIKLEKKAEYYSRVFQLSDIK